MGFDGDSMGILYSYIEPLGEFLEMGDAQFTMGFRSHGHGRPFLRNIQMKQEMDIFSAVNRYLGTKVSFNVCTKMCVCVIRQKIML